MAASLSSILAAPKLEVDKFLSQRPNRGEIDEQLTQFRAYAIEAAKLTGQANPEIQGWAKECPQECIQKAKKRLINLPKHRNSKKNIADLLTVYKDAVKKLERASRRAGSEDSYSKLQDSATAVAEDEPQQTEDVEQNKGMLERMLSGGLLGFFTNSDKTEYETSDGVTSEQPYSVLDPNVENEDSDSPFYREVQSETAYMTSLAHSNTHDRVRGSKSHGETDPLRDYSSDDFMAAANIAAFHLSKVNELSDEMTLISDESTMAADAASEDNAKVVPSSEPAVDSNQAPTSEKKLEDNEGTSKQTAAADDKLLNPKIPVIRLSKTLTEKSFSDDGSCQFLPGGVPGCTRHNHPPQNLKSTKSEKIVSHHSTDKPSNVSAQNFPRRTAGAARSSAVPNITTSAVSNIKHASPSTAAENLPGAEAPLEKGSSPDLAVTTQVGDQVGETTPILDQGVSVDMTLTENVTKTFVQSYPRQLVGRQPDPQMAGKTEIDGTLSLQGQPTNFEDIDLSDKVHPALSGVSPPPYQPPSKEIENKLQDNKQGNVADVENIEKQNKNRRCTIDSPGLAVRWDGSVPRDVTLERGAFTAKTLSRKTSLDKRDDYEEINVKMSDSKDSLGRLESIPYDKPVVEEDKWLSDYANDLDAMVNGCKATGGVLKKPKEDNCCKKRKVGDKYQPSMMSKFYEACRPNQTQMYKPPSEPAAWDDLRRSKVQRSHSHTHVCCSANGKEVTLYRGRSASVSPCSSTSSAEFDNCMEIKLRRTENELLRVQREATTCENYCDQLYAENQRLQSRVDAEKEDKTRVSDKLDRAEVKIDKLQKELVRSKNMLSAANVELSILKEPKLTKVKDNQDLESQLQKALDDRRIAIGQLKNIEKLLEDSIGEKDELNMTIGTLKIELKKLKIDRLAMQDELKEKEVKLYEAAEREKSLHGETENLKDEIRHYQGKHNQAVKRKDEMRVVVEESNISKEYVEELNIKLRTELQANKCKVQKLENELVRCRNELEDAQEQHLDEIQCWKQRVQNSLADVDNAQRAHVQVEREHEKELHKWKKAVDDLQDEIHNFQRGMDEANRTIKHLNEQHEGIVLDTIEALAPPNRSNDKTRVRREKKTAPSYAAVKGKDNGQRKDLSMLLRVANECNDLHDPYAECEACVEKGEAIAHLCHDLCMFVEKERERARCEAAEELPPPVRQLYIPANSYESESSVDVDEVEEPSSMLSSDMEESRNQDAFQRQLALVYKDVGKHETCCDEVALLTKEVERLSQLLDMEHNGSRKRSMEDEEEEFVTLQASLRTLSRENDWLRKELDRIKAMNLDLRLKFEEIKEEEGRSEETMQKAYTSLKNADGVIQKVKSLRSMASMSISTAEGVVDADKDEDEKEKSFAESEAQKSAAERSNMQDSAVDPIKRMVTESDHNVVKHQLKNRVHMIQKLTEQNDALNQEVEALRELLQQPVEKRAETSAELEVTRKKLRKCEIENEKSKREIKMLEEDLKDFANDKNVDKTTAFIVKQREAEIMELKEHLAEQQRVLLSQNKILSGEISQKRSRTSSSRCKAEYPEMPFPGGNKSQIVAIMTEESQKLKSSLQKLEEENHRLSDAMREKDATLVELNGSLKQYEKVMRIDPETGEKEMVGYRHRIKTGESELGRLQVEIETLSKRHNELMTSKEAELLTSRTNYAEQLSSFITDCVESQQCKEKEMKRLCDKLEHIESSNFELAVRVKELTSVKLDLVPKLKGEIEDARIHYEEAVQAMEEHKAARKAAELKLEINGIEKEEIVDRFQTEQLKLKKEIDSEKEEVGYIEKTLREKLEHRESELKQLRKESIESRATAEEKEGAALHWKLKCEDRNRELRDLQEKTKMELKAKDQEIENLRRANRPETVLSVKVPDESEVLELTKHIKDIQQKHIELIKRTNSTEKVQGENIDKFYDEIGNLGIVLHNAVRERDAELVKLNNEVKTVLSEKDIFQEECAKMIQDKQIEIRKLSNEMEKMEVEAAKLNATKEVEIGNLKEELKNLTEKLKLQTAHTNAVKDSQITKLKLENDKLSSLHQKDVKTLHDLREQQKKYESERTQFSLQNDSMQANVERLKKELDQSKHDKKYFEKMVERLNHEMEVRVAAVRRDSTKALQKTSQSAMNIYEKMEKIARERGEISTELQAILKEKENKIEHLTQLVAEYTKSKDRTEVDLRSKMEVKNKEVKSLRSEIKKMGVEGVKLLEQREKEILEMRTHLKNVLKVMESKNKVGKEGNIAPVMEAAMSQLSVNKPVKPKLSRSTNGSGAYKASSKIEPKQQKSAVTTSTSRKIPAKGAASNK